MEKVINLKTINFTDDGYMSDFAQWDREVGVALAQEEGIEMTDAHWAVIDFIHNQFKSEAPLSIRAMKKSGTVDIKEFYKLFPGGPLKVSTKIAGIPKPKSCI